jgi:hypothetical protein
MPTLFFGLTEIEDVSHFILFTNRFSLLTGAEYKEKFSRLASSMDQSSRMKKLSEICTFVDMVPPFRDLASKSRGVLHVICMVFAHMLISYTLC